MASCANNCADSHTTAVISGPAPITNQCTATWHEPASRVATTKATEMAAYDSFGCEVQLMV